MGENGKHVTKTAHLDKMFRILGTSYFSSDDLPEEHWLPFSEWKGCALKQVYKVSDKGRIRNQESKPVPGSIDPHGYHTVTLQYVDSSAAKNSFVHSIVLYTFEGKPPEYMGKPTVQHKDHNPLNNSLENLEWMEMSDNSRDGAHNTLIQFIDNVGTHSFRSKEEASVKYCNKASGYIDDCMKLRIPVVDELGNISVMLYLPFGESQWSVYIPNKSLKPWRVGCIITDRIGDHRFSTLKSANSYLQQNDGYIQYHYKHSMPIVNKVSGECVQFKLLTD